MERKESSKFIIKGPMDRESVPELRRKVLKLIRKDNISSLTVDLSEVSRLDTAGLALLVEWYRFLRRHGGRLKLAGLGEEVKKKIHLARLDKLLESYTCETDSGSEMDRSKRDVTEAAIEVQHLNSFYGDRQVLFDINMLIPRHKVTVIMGVSGCGKSTLLRHLIGLKSIESGEVLIKGRSLRRFGEAQLRQYRRNCGVLFQSGALFNSMSVAENIAVPLKVHTRLADETIRVIAEIKLHQVGLTGLGDYMPSQLSGGMKKRAGLARALALDPEILFVDEPSSGLDPITAAGLDQLIAELRDTAGMTIVVVTHELESAFRIADQMIVMDQGRILVKGTPEAIRKSTDPRVQQFLQREAEQDSADLDFYARVLLNA